MGDFKLRLLIEEKGNSVASPKEAVNFSYIIRVLSVSPSSGSPLGGTELTITGENFSAANKVDNNVFIEIDFRTNVMCTVISATQTQIKCITPPAHPDFKLD